jgi:hypothetical protein
MNAIRPHIREGAALSLPDLARKILLTPGPQLRARPATPHVFRAAFCSVAATGEKVHVVHRPNNTRVLGNRPEKRLVVGKCSQRMDVHDIGGEEVMQQISAVNTSVVTEILEAGRAQLPISREGPADSDATEAPANSICQRGADGKELYGWFFRPLLGDEHAGLVPEAKQRLMEPERGQRRALSVEVREVDDLHEAVGY